jgi:benzaldehyde dehydrogenase (NAD)
VSIVEQKSSKGSGPESFDIRSAAEAIKFGGLFHSGQICMATQTAIVHESIADKFLALLTDKYPSASKSSPDDGTALRGLFTQASAERVKGAVDDALSKGAQIVAGENRLEGNVIQPVLLKGITPEMRIYREEVFAPCLASSPSRPTRRPSSMPTTTTVSLLQFAALTWALRG